MISNLVPINLTRRIATKCAEGINTFDMASSDSVGGGDIGFGGSGGSTPTDADYTAAGLHYDKSTNTWQDANGVETSLVFSHGGSGMALASIGYQDLLGILGGGLGARYAAELGTTEIIGGTIGGVAGLVVGAGLDWAINHPDQVAAGLNSYLSFQGRLALQNSSYPIPSAP